MLRYIELVKAARADSAPYSCEACEGTIEMRKSDVICECGAGFRRIELTSEPGTKGRYCCPACHAVLEAFNGDHLVAYRLKVQPTQGLERAKPVVLPIKLIEGRTYSVLMTRDTCLFVISLAWFAVLIVAILWMISLH